MKSVEIVHDVRGYDLFGFKVLKFFMKGQFPEPVKSFSHNGILLPL